MNRIISMLLLAELIGALAFSSAQWSANRDGVPTNQKRDLIIPGTKWCGIGSRAQSYDDLGTHVVTDKCCREHDQCHYYINAFKSNYGVFNFHWYTVMACNCNAAFAVCLTKANSLTSSQVKKLFFKVLKPACLKFELKEVCTQYEKFRCKKWEKLERATMVSQ